MCKNVQECAGNMNGGRTTSSLRRGFTTLSHPGLYPPDSPIPHILDTKVADKTRRMMNNKFNDRMAGGGGPLCATSPVT